MYPSYSSSGMKPKPEFFRGTYVSSTYTYTYQGWEEKLDGYGALYWPDLSERLAEDFQFGLLRGMAMTGIAVSDWNTVFSAVLNGRTPFADLNKGFFEGQLGAPWLYFAQKLGKEGTRSIHFPPLCPEWLFVYGYTQTLYLSDLVRYWDNVHDNYYKPWTTTRIGQDSPEIVRLKQIGNVARQEIDEVARQGDKYLKR